MQRKHVDWLTSRLLLIEPDKSGLLSSNESVRLQLCVLLDALAQPAPLDIMLAALIDLTRAIDEQFPDA